MSTTDHRTATIAGLRALADFLDATPDLPVPRTSISITYFPKRTDDAGMRAEIDRIAGLLGAQIDLGRLPYSHYSTELRFGPVHYEAIAILAHARARHEAVTSYEDCIIPDTTANPAHAA